MMVGVILTPPNMSDTQERSNCYPVNDGGGYHVTCGSQYVRSAFSERNNNDWKDDQVKDSPQPRSSNSPETGKNHYTEGRLRVVHTSEQQIRGHSPNHQTFGDDDRRCL